jgi:autotransporter-associated beta strand protein
MNAASQVVDTGVVDEFGYPVYDSEVKAVPQLLRQRSLTPATDGGFPSGHTNAFHLAALAFAYAVPERFQELVTAAFDLAETRIVAGMHSPVDVLGGRVLATALAAAILADPANAQLKADARAQALAYFAAQVGADVYGYAHNGRDDAYADRAANERIVTPKLTYGLPAARATTPMTVPQGAEVLLETRQPYLTAAQRREVLRTTALDGGHPVIDGPENWGRLNLFAAADGYGSFVGPVTVTMDAAAGGFNAADTWRNAIDGCGGLVKAGTGTLTLTGANSYGAGTTVTGGTLVAGSASALGRGPVTVTGGTLRLTGSTRVGCTYQQRAGTLAVTGTLIVPGEAVLGAGSVLEVDGALGRDLTVLRAHEIRGSFTKVVATNPAYRATVSYAHGTVTVRLRKA